MAGQPQMRVGWRGTSALAVCIAVLLTACSFYPKLVLLNHTGRDLTIHVDDHGQVGWNERKVLLKDSRSKKLIFGSLIQPNGRMTLTQGGCSYDYRLPEGASLYWDHYSDIHLVLQVEPDLLLYIRPEGRTPIPRMKLSVLQTEGFPLRPVARRCGKGPPNS